MTYQVPAGLVLYVPIELDYHPATRLVPLLVVATSHCSHCSHCKPNVAASLSTSLTSNKLPSHHPLYTLWLPRWPNPLQIYGILKLKDDDELIMVMLYVHYPRGKKHVQRYISRRRFFFSKFLSSKSFGGSHSTYKLLLLHNFGQLSSCCNRDKSKTRQ